jgi:hypothetical protein
MSAFFAAMSRLATESKARKPVWFLAFADVAQLVEHFTRNEGVPSSNLGVGSKKSPAQGLFLWRERQRLRLPSSAVDGHAIGLKAGREQGFLP